MGEGESGAKETTPAHSPAESHAHWGPDGKGFFCWENRRAGGVRACAGCPAAGGGGCAEKRGGVVGAAVLAAVGEGAAAGLLVLRTDAIGASGKVRVQPQTGLGEGEWNLARHPLPAPGAEQSPSTQNPNPIRSAIAAPSTPATGPRLPDPSPADSGDPNRFSRLVWSGLSCLRSRPHPHPTTPRSLPPS